MYVHVCICQGPLLNFTWLFALLSYRFNQLNQYLIEFNQLAMAHAEGSESMLNRVMPRDNIGIAVLLELQTNGSVRLPCQHILVANAHIHWDPEFADVKLIQTVMLMNELDNIVMTAQAERGIGCKTTVPGMPGIPIIFCGDLNSLPESSVVQYLVNGRVPIDHADLQGHGYEGFLARFSASVRPGMRSPLGKPELIHQFNLKHAYSNVSIPFTNYTYDFKGVIDYILFSADFFNPTGILGPVSSEWLKQCKIIGCPNPHFPSDHFPLLCEFELYPTQH